MRFSMFARSQFCGKQLSSHIYQFWCGCLQQWQSPTQAPTPAPPIYVSLHSVVTACASFKDAHVIHLHHTVYISACLTHVKVYWHLPAEPNNRNCGDLRQRNSHGRWVRSVRDVYTVDAAAPSCRPMEAPPPTTFILTSTVEVILL